MVGTLSHFMASTAATSFLYSPDLRQSGAEHCRSGSQAYSLHAQTAPSATDLLHVSCGA